MDPFALFLAAILVIGVGPLLYGRIKHGSWTGSFLKGRIDRTIGEVTVSSGFATQTFAIHSMQANTGEADFVALVFVAKAPLGASMQPYKLTKVQAQELANYLMEAAK
jgi:hypothetical protein